MFGLRRASYGSRVELPAFGVRRTAFGDEIRLAVVRNGLFDCGMQIADWGLKKLALGAR